MKKKLSKIPELRFSDYYEEWIEKKLSEVSKCLDNKRIPINLYKNKLALLKSRKKVLCKGVLYERHH